MGEREAVGGRGGERENIGGSQRRSPNKADLLFCSSLQGCNSLLCLFHPSIPVLSPLFLFFFLQASASKSQMCKCYKAPSALKTLDFVRAQV